MVSYPERESVATYPCKEDEYRQNEVRSENQRKVDRSIPYDRPDDSSEPNIPH